jgi:hypothetical protein
MARILIVDGVLALLGVLSGLLLSENFIDQFQLQDPDGRQRAQKVANIVSLYEVSTPNQVSLCV